LEKTLRSVVHDVVVSQQAISGQVEQQMRGWTIADQVTVNDAADVLSVSDDPAARNVLRGNVG
jgi:hypothetical protein